MGASRPAFQEAEKRVDTVLKSGVESLERVTNICFDDSPNQDC